MDTLNSFLQTDLGNGATIGDFLTYEYLAAIAGSIVGAIAIIVAAFIIYARWKYAQANPPAPPPQQQQQAPSPEGP